jgi:hypothetical protein
MAKPHPPFGGPVDMYLSDPPQKSARMSASDKQNTWKHCSKKLNAASTSIDLWRHIAGKN